VTVVVLTLEALHGFPTQGKPPRATPDARSV
jgi:hypothetical protein